MERMTKVDENMAQAKKMLSGIVERCYELEEENKKLREKLQWWKDLVQKAKEFEYDEDGMDYIWQNTKI